MCVSDDGLGRKDENAEGPAFQGRMHPNVIVVDRGSRHIWSDRDEVLLAHRSLGTPHKSTHGECPFVAKGDGAQALGSRQATKALEGLARLAAYA